MSRPEAADWLIAHRGYPHAYPENSLVGVEAALKAGARWVEFDIQLTRDGVPVVVHDASLGRVGDSHEAIAALDWDTLSRHSIGEPARFGAEFARQRVPRLADMLALLDRYPGVTAFVEIKRESLQEFGRAAVVGAVCSALQQATTRCVTISFDAAALAIARKQGAEAIGLVIKTWNAASRREAERLAPDYLFVEARRVPGGDRPFWPGEWQWVVYVVDDPDSAVALRCRGADMIETDRFEPMLAALGDLQSAAGGKAHGVKSDRFTFGVEHTSGTTPMAESNQDEGRQTADASESSRGEAAPRHDEAQGYPDHVRSVFSAPDAFFEPGHRSDRTHALIDLAVYAAAVYLAALFARITGYSGWGFEFGYFLDAAKSVLTIGIPLACAVFALSAYGKRSGQSHSTGFYMEKLGAGLLLPAVLLIGALVLDLLDIRIHAWLRGLSNIFVYVLIFTFAYRYATPGRLTVAAGFLAGFYVLYRLLALLF